MKLHTTLPLLLLLFGIAACKKNEVKPDISICVTGLHEYRSDSISWEIYPGREEWQENSFIQFGVEQALFRQIDAGNFKAEIYHWDISIMNSENIRHNRHDWLDGYDYFLVFSQVPTTDTTQCCIKLSAHRGRPYNQNSMSFADFTECARIGDYDSISNTPVYDKGRACKVAAGKAAIMAVRSGLLK